ncbi:MAG TPA: flagellar basal body P-ring formation chaperone FlgA [Chthonomonadaceae bacterium]|nr:flagellar basal body P-ring formation chaperone FlgA [Chthonomonadaceae bacterium]
MAALRMTLTLAVALAVSAAAGAQTAPSRSAVKPSTKPGAARPAKSPAAAAKTPDRVETVLVRPNSEVTGPVFTLGEIADIQGDDPALGAQLAAIEMGASPLPGLARIINPGDVTVRLRQHQLDVPRVKVTLPPGMRISRNGHDIAADEISAAAIASAKDAIKGQPDATLEVVGGGGSHTVATGKTQILAGAWRGNPEIGAITVPVSILVDGAPVQTVDVALRIHRKMMALVATHAIQLHEIVGPQDVAMMSIDVPSGPASPLTSIEESLGKRATRRISAMAPISADMLEKAPLITANDEVTIELIYGALRVTAAGLARQTGGEGDRIRVCATDTKKELVGIVVDKHTVRVEDDGNP